MKDDHDYNLALEPRPSFIRILIVSFRTVMNSPKENLIIISELDVVNFTH